ncbi:MAG: glycosyltransferase family 4 protein [Gemmatimonadota bacterium]
MRILYIVTAFPRHSGEVMTPWLIETIGRLRARGVDVEVLAPSYRGSGDQVVDGTRVHRFRYAPALLETLTHDQTTPDRLRERPAYLGLVPGYVAAGSIAAARLARTGRFDAVHAFWPLPHGLLGLAARAITGVPLVSTFFGVELTWARRHLPFLTPLLRAIIRRSDAVTVISSYTGGEVRVLVPEVKVRTIPFGAASESHAMGATRRDESRGAGEQRLLFVGRLVERKGVDVLLRALATLRVDRDVRLTVVGDGPLRPALEGLAVEVGVRDAVEFTGTVSQEELRRRYAGSDIFVLPAVRDRKGDVEGLGVVLIEALQYELPVVASESGGIPDVVEDGRTGLLVPPGDTDALASAIGRLIEDPELARRLARAGREDVAVRFSWDRIVTELMTLYEDVRRSDAGSPADGTEGWA